VGARPAGMAFASNLESQETRRHKPAELFVTTASHTEKKQPAQREEGGWRADSRPSALASKAPARARTRGEDRSTVTTKKRPKKESGSRTSIARRSASIPGSGKGTCPGENRGMEERGKWTRAWVRARQKKIETSVGVRNRRPPFEGKGSWRRGGKNWHGACSRPVNGAALYGLVVARRSADQFTVPVAVCRGRRRVKGGGGEPSDGISLHREVCFGGARGRQATIRRLGKTKVDRLVRGKTGTTLGRSPICGEPRRHGAEADRIVAAKEPRRKGPITAFRACFWLTELDHADNFARVEKGVGQRGGAPRCKGTGLGDGFPLSNFERPSRTGRKAHTPSEVRKTKRCGGGVCHRATTTRCGRDRIRNPTKKRIPVGR